MAPLMRSGHLVEAPSGVSHEQENITMLKASNSTPLAKDRRHLLPVLALVLLPMLALAQAPGCGNPFQNHFGPWDYRTAPRPDLRIVEQVHFTPGVESLTRPGTTTYREMAADVAYTLHVFPNHHRALLTMTRLVDRHNSEQPPGAKFTMTCYFERAIQYTPDDTVARSLYAMYLGKTNRRKQALHQLRVATEYAGDNPLSHYNIGLLSLELGEPAMALEREHSARAMGLQRPELEAALRRAGHWRDPAVPN